MYKVEVELIYFAFSLFRREKKHQNTSIKGLCNGFLTCAFVNVL